MDKRIFVFIVISALISMIMIGAKAYALSPEDKQGLLEYYRSVYKNAYGDNISDEEVEAKAQQSLNEMEAAIANGSCTVTRSSTTSEEQYVDDDKDKYITYVNSVDDFLEEVCYQLKEHRTVEYYDTDVEELYNNSQFVFDEIEKFYYKNDPMMSSSYLIGFCDINSPNYSWQERNIPGEKKYRIGITFEYLYTEEEIEEHMNEVKELSQSLKRENDLESIKAVHDYLIDKFFWKNKINDSISGFKYGGVTCDGYSMAAFELLNNMGINNRIVQGEVIEDNKKYYNNWNIVQLDGKWYNLDISWDDAAENGARYDWFLKSNADFERHSYQDSSSDIRDIIAQESYTVPEELLKTNVNESENDTTTQVSVIENEKTKMTPKDLVKRFWYLALYILFSIIAFIRRNSKRKNDSFVRYTDDLTAELEAYYKGKGRSYFDDKKYENKLLSQIGLFYIFLVVVMLTIGAFLMPYFK